MDDDTSLTSSFLTVEYLTKPYVMLLVLTAVLSVLYTYYRIVYAPYQVFKSMGVEGPEPQPLWGNTSLYERLGEYKMFEHLHCTYGPISGFYLREKPYLLVIDLKMLKELMVDAAGNFDEEDGTTGIHGLPLALLPCKGKERQRFHNIFAAAFTPPKLMTMVPLLAKPHERLLEILGEAVDSGGDIEIWSVSCALSLEVLCNQLGESAKVQTGVENKLIRAIRSFFNPTTNGTPSESSKSNTAGVKSIITTALMSLKHLGKRVETHKEVKDIAEAVSELVQKCKYQYQRESEKPKTRHIQRRFSEPATLTFLNKLLPQRSFLQILIEGFRNKNLTDAEILSCCMVFLLSGYETIASTLAHTCYELTLNGLLQEKLFSTIDAYFRKKPIVSLFNATKDIKYLDMIVQETLRLHAPTSKIVRHCVEPCVVRGIHIAPGTRVIIPVNFIHHFSEYWEEPNEFRPERMKEGLSKDCHLPFGNGPQCCVGMEFAMMEVKIALIEILRKYKFMKAPNTQIPLESKEGSTRRPASGIHLKIKKRSRTTSMIFSK